MSASSSQGPASPSSSAPTARPAELGGPYLLTVATLEPRKNLGTLVDAFGLLADTGLSLVVAGGSGWGEQPELDRPGIVRLGRVSDDELARLYRGAAAVVYPSRFEGFGMPITEAMASGAPVVASAHPSLDEAAGDSRGARRPREPGSDRRRRPRSDRAPRRAARARSRARAALLLAAGRRALPGGVRAIRVALDTTPLVQTRAGTARYVRALRDGLGDDVIEVQYPATSRGRTAGRRRALVPAASRTRGRRRLALPDVPRAVPRARQPLVVTVHDLAVLRHPEWFNRWTRRTRASPCRASSRAATRVIAVSEFTKRESRVAARCAGGRRSMSCRTRVEDVFTAGRAACRRRLRARRRHARAAQEPRADRAGGRWGAARGRGARVGRGRRRRANVTWLGDVSDDASWLRSTAARAASSTPRSTRGSGSRSPRRSPAAVPVVTSAGLADAGAGRRRRRSTSTRPTSSRSGTAIAGARFGRRRRRAPTLGRGRRRGRAPSTRAAA